MAHGMTHNAPNVPGRPESWSMSQAPIPLRPHLLRRAHLRVLVAGMDLAQSSLARRDVLRAAGRFFGRPFRSAQTLSDHLNESDAHSHFYPWLLWDARLGEAPLGARMMERWPPSSAERLILCRLLETEVDVYQVNGSNAHATVLEHLATGRCVPVCEPVLQVTAVEREILIARVVELEDIALLDAVHACLPAPARRGLIRAGRRLPGLVREARLAHLLRASGRALDRINRQTVRLTGPAGEPWMRATVVFAIEQPLALRRSLGRLAAAGHLLERGSSRYAIADDTFGPTGATIRVHGERLYATTTSVQRCRELRACVEEGGDGVRFLCTLYRDLEELIDPSQWDEREEGELQSVLQDWVDEVLARFPDTPQASLGDITPREAVRTRRGRNQVLALLRTVEQISEVAGPSYSRAVATIWSDLTR